MILRRTLAALAAALVAALALVGCQIPPYVDPCSKLPAPTAQQLAVAVPPVEVEQEYNGRDCELVGGHWVSESD